MTQVLVHRPARTRPPATGSEPTTVSPPPSLGNDIAGWGWYTYLFPVVGAMGALVFALFNRNPVYLIGASVFILGAVGMGVALFLQQRNRPKLQTGVQRRRYLRYLAEVRAELRTAAARQREAAEFQHPEPGSLDAVVTSPARRWERRPGDEDFLVLRIGRGAAALTPALQPPRETDPTREVDPVSIAALERLLAAHGTVTGVPVGVPTRGRVVSVLGERERGRALVRAMLAQAAALHAPDDLRVAVCCDEDAVAQWEWVKWLPHAAHPDGGDGRPRTLVARGPAELNRLLGAELAHRRSAQGWQHRRQDAAHGPAALLVVVDLEQPPPSSADPLADAADIGVGVIRLAGRQEHEPEQVHVRLQLHRPQEQSGSTLLQLHRPGGGERRRGGAPLGREVEAVVGSEPPLLAVHDVLSVAEAETLARTIAPLRLSRTAADRGLVEMADLADLLGVADPGALDPAVAWRPREVPEQLRVPLGVDAAGKPVVLDLKESALNGMGPHGLAVGATGSGKSELLRTLVTALAATHHPETLAFVLVDYKGGATFAGMTSLPHVSGLITNLEADPTLVDRMHDALHGEMRRREQVLRDSGNLTGIREYNQRRAQHPEMPPLPFLLVIVDEFTELLAEKPDFIEMFVTLGRLGRSLGMHLLLSTQRLEEGRLRGLESHLSYRIGLRTFSSAESRIVLGTSDAYELPPVPGSAYLKVDTSVYTRMRVATVSMPYVPPETARARRAVYPKPESFEAVPAGGEQAPAPAGALTLPMSDPSRQSVLDVVVDRLSGAAAQVHQVWLPPLPSAIALGRLLPEVREVEGRGLAAAGWSGSGRLSVPVGAVDRPRQQRQELLVVSLSGATGSLAVAGGPRTGKSTLLRTLVLSAALTHTPEEVQFYCLDFGGGLIGALGGLPHVGVVAGRLEADLVRRVVAEMSALLEHRERYWQTAGIVTVDDLRSRRAAGERLDDQHGDVFLVIDGWTVVRNEFEDQEQAIIDLATRGLNYGIHVIVTAGRWLDMRPNLRDAIGGRLEFRLGEPSDSLLDRQAARRLPDMPGRVLVPGGHVGQVAVPYLDEQTGVDAAVRRVADAWRGPAAPPVRLLPTRLPMAELAPLVDPRRRGVPVGIGERDLKPVHLDLLGGDPHLLVLGDGESGKTNLLRALMQGLAARYSPEQAQLLVIDPRRTLLDAVDERYLLAYAGSAQAARDLVEQVAAKVATRQPGPDVTVQQLRERSWWTGPEAYLIVDDYDLMPTGNDPLERLVDLLPSGRDLGLHLVLARRLGGFVRATFSPVLRRLVELHTPGLLFSGSAEEGPVLEGQKPRSLVPGRALLARRGHRTELVQTAWVPDEDAEERAA